MCECTGEGTSLMELLWGQLMQQWCSVLQHGCFWPSSLGQESVESFWSSKGMGNRQWRCCCLIAWVAGVLLWDIWRALLLEGAPSCCQSGCLHLWRKSLYSGLSAGSSVGVSEQWMEIHCGFRVCKCLYWKKGFATLALFFRSNSVSPEQDTRFLFVTTHVSVGGASPHLSGADNVLVAGLGWFCADPSPAFAVVLPHSQLPLEWPASPEGWLPSLPFPSTCWSLFSHVGCAGGNSQATCKACASTRTLQGSWNECLEAGDGSQCHHLGHPTVACSVPYSKGMLSLRP